MAIIDTILFAVMKEYHVILKLIFQLRRLSHFFYKLAHHERPIRYFFSRAFVNFPAVFGWYFFSRNGYKLSASPNSLTASFFLYGERYLNEDEALLASVCRTGDFFIDVGANIGHISLALARNSGARGVAVEPSRQAFLALRKNILLNNLDLQIIPLECLVTAHDGRFVEFQESCFDDNNCVAPSKVATLGEPSLYLLEPESRANFVGRTLDSLSVEHRFPCDIRLLKIDVEGYEREVLLGARTILPRIQIIYFEFWERLTWKYGYSWYELFFLLQSYGFKVYSLRRPMRHFGVVSFEDLVEVTEDFVCGVNTNLFAFNNKFQGNSLIGGPLKQE